MSNGYGQIFLLLLAIGLILLGASGKGKAVWDALRGQPAGTGIKDTTEKETPQYKVPDVSVPGNDADKANSGDGGVMA